MTASFAKEAIRTGAAGGVAMLVVKAWRRWEGERQIKQRKRHANHLIS